MTSGQACHNCRRRRLKCDRSLPHCLKCQKTKQECLGYGKLFRWENGVASRGKMTGVRYDEVIKGQTMHQNGNSLSRMSTPSLLSYSSGHSSGGSTEVSSPTSLTDPLVQDVSLTSRKYLFYFASDLCKDLVLYNLPQHNPFFDLIPMTQEHPILLHIIVANAALHMSNASQKILLLAVNGSPSDSCSGSSAGLELEPYRDALVARQKALCLLKSALENLECMDIDVTLAVVLLFIEFELIDSGRDNWKHHIKGARTIIERLCGTEAVLQIGMSPLRKCLIQNCLVFDILGSTLASPTKSSNSERILTGTLSLLQDAEGNHCSSFPAVLLQLLQNGASILSEHYDPPTSSSSSTYDPCRQIIHLIDETQQFDHFAWADNIAKRSTNFDQTDELYRRTWIAWTHKQAVCIYLCRALLVLDPKAELPVELDHLTNLRDFEDLVETVVDGLAQIHQTDALFAATTWPMFVVGAETNDRGTRVWIEERFRDLWMVEPWGVIKNALGVLESIWAEKRLRAEVDPKAPCRNWIEILREKEVDWLII